MNKFGGSINYILLGQFDSKLTGETRQVPAESIPFLEFFFSKIYLYNSSGNSIRVKIFFIFVFTSEDDIAEELCVDEELGNSDYHIVCFIFKVSDMDAIGSGFKSYTFEEQTYGLCALL